MNLILYTLITTHITIIAVTLYLHRSQTHLAVTFNPIVNHFFRFWLWLTTGMVTRQWVAIHRKHHRFSDEAKDPHSPHVYGIWNVLFKGLSYYVREGKNTQTIMSYGKGTPKDWIERNLYTPHNFAGVFLLLIINLIIFGWLGIISWIIQMIWIPFWAAGVINGLGHWFGYRNTETKEKSKNIIPIGIIIGGEELHNNHHDKPASCKLSSKWFEFDIGYFYIKILEFFKLAKINNRGQ